jgi:hypothetical protein
VPDGLQQIVSWMIEKDPARRYPTPERAAGALKAFLLVGQETAAEPDQKLQQYESWLELEAVKGPPAPEHQPREKRSEREKNRKPAAKRPLKPAPAEKSEAPPPLELPPLELPPPEPAGRPGPKGKKKRRPLAPVAPPIDVELVALPPTTLAGEQKLFSLPLTRRDLVMFALGVGTVLLAIAIGALGVLLISSLS